MGGGGGCAFIASYGGGVGEMGGGRVGPTLVVALSPQHVHHPHSGTTPWHWFMQAGVTGRGGSVGGGQATPTAPLHHHGTVPYKATSRGGERRGGGGS